MTEPPGQSSKSTSGAPAARAAATSGAPAAEHRARNDTSEAGAVHDDLLTEHPVDRQPRGRDEGLPDEAQGAGHDDHPVPHLGERPQQAQHPGTATIQTRVQEPAHPCIDRQRLQALPPEGTGDAVALRRRLVDGRLGRRAQVVGAELRAQAGQRLPRIHTPQHPQLADISLDEGAVHIESDEAWGGRPGALDARGPG